MTSNSITFISDFIDASKAILQLWQSWSLLSLLTLHIFQRTYNDARKTEWLLRRRRRIEKREGKRTKRNRRWTYHDPVGQSPALNSDACIQFQASLHGICGGKSHIGTGFSSCTSVFLRKCYHSTSGLYSFSSTADAILCNLSNLHCCLKKQTLKDGGK